MKSGVRKGVGGVWNGGAGRGGTAQQSCNPITESYSTQSDGVPCGQYRSLDKGHDYTGELS